MYVVRYDDVEAFYARVEPYLAAHEAEHNLTFGILSTIRDNPSHYDQPFLWLVEGDAPPGQENPVLLVALMTLPRPPVLSLAAIPTAVDWLAAYLSDTQIALPGINGPADESRRFAEMWTRLKSQRFEVHTPLRTFKLEQVKPMTGIAGFMREATLDDRDLLIAWELAFRREAFPDDIHTHDDAARAVDFRFASKTNAAHLWQDGDVIVSLTAWGGPTPNGIRIGPVYTPPEQRGQGYASALVAEVSQQLLDSGRKFCFLFTDQRNPTSNHIYQVIGYQPVCDFTEYSFSDSSRSSSNPLT